MSTSIRGVARAVLNTYPFSRFRSFEERLGIVGFAMLLLIVTSQSLFSHDFKAGDLEIGHPRSRATPPGAKVAAGYVVIRNTGSEPDRLIAASGEIAARTEIHEMSVGSNGVMTMRPIEGVEVPAGDSAELKPGGLHIMFMDLKSGPREGERFKGTLTFEKAGTVEVEFAVEGVAGDAGRGSGHDGHGDHGAVGDGQDDAAAIRHVLMQMFDKPDSRLGVEPVTVKGDIAVAGWAQGEMAGRALLRRKDGNWSIALCSGDALREAKALRQFGLTTEQADEMANAVVEAESKLDPALVARFATFDGVMMMDANGGHPSVSGHDAGHGQHGGGHGG